MTAEINDYAIIGDGRSCALVSKAGSIDFLCWPRFDSEACLAAVLGDERRGYYLIAPASFVSEMTRRYRDDTAILVKEHLTQTGLVQVTDVMPWSDGPSAISRIVEGLEGEVKLALLLRLRFRNRQIAPWRQRQDSNQMDRALLDRLNVLGELIHDTICERGYSDSLVRFVVHFDSDGRDALLLLLPLVGFLPADDPRIVGTIAAV